MACLRYFAWLVGWLVVERVREKNVKQIESIEQNLRETGLESKSVDGTTTVEYNDLHTLKSLDIILDRFSHGIHHSTRRSLVAVEAIARFQVHRPGTMPAARQSLFHTV